MVDSFADPTLGGLEIILFGVRAAVLLAVFAAFTWALLRMRREAAEQAERLQHSQRELAAQTLALSERVAALAMTIASMPREIERSERSERNERPVSESLPPPPLAKPRRQNGAPSYETAKRLARSGASVAEIVAGSGVASTEARLLLRLQCAEPDHDNEAA